MPEFDKKGNSVRSQNEEFIILFLLEVRKAYNEFYKHTFYRVYWFLNVSIFIFTYFFLTSLSTNIQQAARLVFTQL